MGYFVCFCCCQNISICTSGLASAVLLRGRRFIISTLFFVIVWHGNCLNECGLRDAIVVTAVKAPLESWQILVTDMEATVVSNPSGEVVHADVTHVAVVHVSVETLTIQLQLVALVIHLGVSLDHEAEDGGQLLEPGALEQVLLLDAQVGRARVSTSARSHGVDRFLPLTEINRAIIVIVNQLDKSFDIGKLDVVFTEDLIDLIDCDFTALIDVEQAERLTD